MNIKEYASFTIGQTYSAVTYAVTVSGRIYQVCTLKDGDKTVSWETGTLASFNNHFDSYPSYFSYPDDIRDFKNNGGYLIWRGKYYHFNINRDSEKTTNINILLN